MSFVRVSTVALVVLAALLSCKKAEKQGPSVDVGSNDPSGPGEVKIKAGGVEINAGPDGGSIETPSGTVGATGGDCKSGEPCVCNGMGACSKTCRGGGCKFECHGMGACTFACPDGKCTAVSDAIGEVSLSCAGGDCTLDCKGTGSCNLTGCKSGCKALCKGVGTCSCPSGCK